MTELWTEARRAALGTFCDAVVPRLERDEDPGGFWARSATDLGPRGAAWGDVCVARTPTRV